MAVSHQLFIQWSAPSTLFADITNKYNNVNNWSNYDRQFNEYKEIRTENYNYVSPDISRDRLSGRNNNWPDKLRYNGE